MFGLGPRSVWGQNAAMMNLKVKTIVQLLLRPPIIGREVAAEAGWCWWNPGLKLQNRTVRMGAELRGATNTRPCARHLLRRPGQVSSAQSGQQSGLLTSEGGRCRSSKMTRFSISISLVFPEIWRRFKAKNLFSPRSSSHYQRAVSVKLAGVKWRTSASDFQNNT